MSVSLALIPLVLIIRVTMGKENFDNWVESSEVKMPTTIKDFNELTFILKKAGYDVINLGNLIKTHMNGKKEFFFWENINGNWTAVFSKYDSQETVNKFIRNLELSEGRSIFNCNYNTLLTQMKNVEETLNHEEIYPTNFVDENLLIDTLKDYGVNITKKPNGEIQCKIENSILTFCKENNSNYVLKINGVSSLKNIYEELNILDEQYKKNVQSYTYNKVTEKLRQNNMSIESEEIMEDNSLMLTININ